MLEQDPALQDCSCLLDPRQFPVPTSPPMHSLKVQTGINELGTVTKIFGFFRLSKTLLKTKAFFISSLATSVAQKIREIPAVFASLSGNHLRYDSFKTLSFFFFFDSVCIQELACFFLFPLSPMQKTILAEVNNKT